MATNKKGSRRFSGLYVSTFTSSITKGPKSDSEADESKHIKPPPPKPPRINDILKSDECNEEEVQHMSHRSKEYIYMKYFSQSGTSEHFSFLWLEIELLRETSPTADFKSIPNNILRDCLHKIYSQYLSENPYFTKHCPSLLEDVRKELNSPSPSLSIFESIQRETTIFLTKDSFLLWKRLSQSLIIKMTTSSEDYTACVRAAHGLVIAEVLRLVEDGTSLWIQQEDSDGIVYFKRPSTTLASVRVRTTVPIDPHKMMDIIMSHGEERKKWDEVFVEGRIVQQLGEEEDVLKLLSRATWCGGKKREFLVARISGSAPDGSYLAIWSSIFHPEISLREDYLRTDADLCGFILAPEGKERDRTCINYISQINFHEKASSSLEINMKQAKHIVSKLRKYALKRRKVTEKIWAEIQQRKMFLPFEGRAIMTRIDVKSFKQANEQETGEVAHNTNNKERELTFEEGDPLWVLQRLDSNRWSAYSLRQRALGIVDLDYIIPLPKLYPPSSTSLTSPTTLPSSAQTLNSSSVPSARNVPYPYEIKFSTLAKVLAQPDLSLAIALCSASTQVPRAIIQTLQEKSSQLPLLLVCKVISMEIENTREEGTLFRGDGLASSLMTAYGLFFGSQYLEHTLRPLISLVNKHHHDGFTLEIDPLKIEAPDHSLEQNLNDLIQITRTFLYKIFNSVPQLPSGLRGMCSYLMNQVEKKFPRSKYSSIGGFFFLRFICPAIVSPSGYNILSEGLHQNTRRGLILVSKILQNISNGTLFGDKEPHMAALNPFLEENKSYVQGFLDSLCDTSAHFNSEEEMIVTRPLMDTDKLTHLLYSEILFNLHKICLSLQKPNLCEDLITEIFRWQLDPLAQKEARNNKSSSIRKKKKVIYSTFSHKSSSKKILQEVALDADILVKEIEDEKKQIDMYKSSLCDLFLSRCHEGSEKIEQKQIFEQHMDLIIQRAILIEKKIGLLRDYQENYLISKPSITTSDLSTAFISTTPPKQQASNPFSTPNGHAHDYIIPSQ